MRTKKNNKGFTLVELIVVMAIMAILVGALAPQVVKYVEKARESKDLQAISTAFTAVQTAIASSETTIVNVNGELSSTGLGATLYGEVSGLLSSNADTSDKIIAACKSKATTGKHVFVTYDESTGYLAVYISTAVASYTDGAAITAADVNTAVKTAITGATGTVAGLGPVTNQ